MRGLQANKAGAVQQDDATRPQAARELPHVPATRHERAALALIDQGVALYDRQARLLYCNDRFRTLCGAPAAVLQPGTSFAALCGALWQAGTVAGSWTSEADWRQSRLAQHRRGRGQSLHRLAGGRWLRLDDRPGAEGTAVLGSDVTDQRREREARSASAARFMEVIDSLSVGFVAFDRNDRLVLCNRAYRELYPDGLDLYVPGTPFEALLRRYAYCGTIAEARGREEAWIRERLAAHREGAAAQMQAQIDGRTIQILEHRTAGGGIASICRDVTEEMRSARSMLEKARLLRLAEEVAELGHWRIDLASGETYWSDEVYRIYGRSRQAGAPDLDAVVNGFLPAERPAVTAYMQHAIESRGGFEFTMRLRRKDGEVRRVLVRGQCELEPGGTPVALFGVLQDVTDRVEADEMLQRNEALLRSMFEMGGVGTALLSPEGDFVRVNGAYCAFLGYSEDELLGLSYRDVSDADEAAISSETLQLLRRGGRSTPSREKRYRCKDGSYRWGLVTLARLPALSGEPEHFLVQVSDITAKREALAALAASEKQLRLFVENAPVAVAMLDRELLFLHVSRRWIQDARMQGPEIIGRTIDAVAEAVPASWHEVRPRLLAGERVSLDEDIIVWKDGSSDWYRWEAHPWHDVSGSLAGVVLFAERITERKRQEQQLKEYAAKLEASNRELEQFAYVASHDLKAPLRAIDNLAEWVEEDLGPALHGESRENMALLRGRVRRLETLLTELLEYSRAGRAAVTAERVNVAALVGEIVDYLSPPGDFQVVCEGPMPCFETGKAALEQVLRNLIWNAVKHHDREGGRITLRSEEWGSFYRFSVGDDGPGIAPEFHARIFEMFQTLRPRDQVEGSGMGLAIVKKLVQRQGGRIDVCSEPGRRGTRFRFEWPKQWA